MLSAAVKIIPCLHPPWEATLYAGKYSSTPYLILVKFVTFRHSKNNKACSRVLETDGSPMCLVSLLRAYLHVRPDPLTGTLFLNRDRSVVMAKLLSHIPLASLHPEAITTDGITPHSLCIGATTTTANQGALDSQLKLLGQWHSEAYNSYIHPGAVGFKLQGHYSCSRNRQPAYSSSDHTS